MNVSAVDNDIKNFPRQLAKFLNCCDCGGNVGNLHTIELSCIINLKLVRGIDFEKFPFLHRGPLQVNNLVIKMTSS